MTGSIGVPDLGPASYISEVDLVWEEAGHDHGHGHAEGDDHADEHMQEGDDHADEHMHEGDHDHDHDGHSHGPEEPHFRLDPLAMRAVVEAMTPAMAELGLDVEDRADAFAAELEALDAEIEAILSGVEEDQRKVVTGHEALGYFATARSARGSRGATELAGGLDLLREVAVAHVVRHDEIDGTAEQV